MDQSKVICIGEALIDRIIGQSNNHDFTNHFGGAPANVCCALRKLNIRSAFIGRLGNDSLGKNFIEVLRKLGVDLSLLQIDRDFPTRIVKVLRDKEGDRSFIGFDNSNSPFFADELIDKKIFEKNIESLQSIYLETKYIVTGTILLSSKKSSEAVNFLLEYAQDFDIKIVIDLNWRDIFWDNSSFMSNIPQKEHLKIVEKFLIFANILKLSKEEAELIFEITDPLEISKSLPKSPNVIITDGPNPIFWFFDGIQGKSEVIDSSEIIDTTGAGDAFLAGLISQLIKFPERINESEIQKCIKFAGTCGLLTCLGEGAIEYQPSISKVQRFLRN